jgi:uncharacterized protein YqeY
MTLREQLNIDLRDALRSGDELRKTTLRMLIAAVHNAEIPPEQPNLRPTDEQQSDLTREEAEPRRRELDDDAVLDVVRREVKQRRDSIDAYRKASREDLAAREEAEANLLVAYLPAQMSRDEISRAARAIIERVGARSPADKGTVMPLVIAELRGRAEGREINAVVTELLAQAP